MRADPGHRPVVVVSMLSLAGLSFAVLQSLVAPALPAIADDLGVSGGDASWVLTTYLLSASVLTPILSRLGDLRGKRTVLLGVLIVLGLSTVLAALVTTLPLLVGARALQGAAGAILPLSIGIVRDELPERHIGVAIGLLSAVFAIGGGLGIVVAGPIVDLLSWHWLFWFPVPLIALAFVGIAVSVPARPVRGAGRLDLRGAAVLSVSLVGILLAITEGRRWGWTDARTLALLAVGVIGLVAFTRLERAVHEPLVDVRLLATRAMWTTNLSATAFGFAMFGVFLLVPSLLQTPTATGHGFGASVTVSGLHLVPTTVMIAVFGPLSGAMSRRWSPRTSLVAGALALTAAFVLPALGHDRTWQIVACTVLAGIGMGLAFAAMSNLVVVAVPSARTAEAIGVNSLVRTVGGSLGSAGVGAVLATATVAGGEPADSAFTAGFWTVAVSGLLALAASLAVPRASRPAFTGGGASRG